MPLVPDIVATEAAIVEMTNAYRRENKQAHVRIDPVLSAAARSYAKFLAQSQLFSHTADGRQPGDRVKAAGYDYCQVAENLAVFLDSRGFETRQLARQMMDGWKKSPGHQRNLVTPHVTEIGVGIFKASKEEKYYSVQLFARPARLKYRFEVQNRSNVSLFFSFGGKRQSIRPRYAIRLTACQPSDLVFELPDGSRPTFGTRDGSVFTLKRGRDNLMVVISGTLDHIKINGPAASN